jgi:putative aldouronate transport system permease protein
MGSEGVIVAEGRRVVRAGARRPGLRRPGLRRPGLRRSLRRYWQLYALMAPAIAYFLVFKYIPMVNAVMAFKDYKIAKGIWGSPWTGWANFDRMFDNPVFWRLVRNTLQLSAYSVFAGFPIPIILALALNQLRLGLFRRSVQIVTYAPYFISTVVVVSILTLVLAPRLGLLNRAVGIFGVESPDLLGSPDYFRHVYVWSDIWQGAGYSAVIYLAALSAIDPALHEAARVDGASRLQRIIHVDIPGIAPTAAMVLILGVGNIMAIGFEKAFLLQNPLNLRTSEILSTYVYKTGLISADYSLATAVGLFNAVVNLVLLLTVNVFSKRVTGRGLWS